jgi:hypothetical protein
MKVPLMISCALERRKYAAPTTPVKKQIQLSPLDKRLFSSVRAKDRVHTMASCQAEISRRGLGCEGFSLPLRVSAMMDFPVCGLGLEAGSLRNNRSGVLLRLAESDAEGKGAARSISLPHSEWIELVLSLLLVVV